MGDVRQSIQHTLSVDERLAQWAREAREQARPLPDSMLRDALLEKARRYETQISMHVSVISGEAEARRAGRAE
ncbi:hypothetical protein IC762_30095 [Bradyrhizobium genosp. L]|nr:hypothetical protein IC762_30095 [Bradyrhizobium genosp. L]